MRTASGTAGNLRYRGPTVNTSVPAPAATKLEPSEVVARYPESTQSPSPIQAITTRQADTALRVARGGVCCMPTQPLARRRQVLLRHRVGPGSGARVRLRLPDY